MEETLLGQTLCSWFRMFNLILFKLQLFVVHKDSDGEQQRGGGGSEKCNLCVKALWPHRLPFRGHCLVALSSLGLLNGWGVKAAGR